MLSHFSYKPIFEDKSLPGWYIRFYFKGSLYEATYHKDGSIDWRDQSPPAESFEKVTSNIHELMLFHVYE